jgi:hypothetical protein
MMHMKRIDAFIDPEDYVIVTDMNEIVEVQYMAHRNISAPIKKLSKEEFVDLQTGEIKQFQHLENRGQNVNSLRQTFKKLGYLVNNNFSGAKNELWVTLTYKENITDLAKVSKDFDKFIKRWKYFLQKYYGKNIAKKYKDEEIQKKSKMEFIKVLEPQGRGAWHIHLLVKFPNLNSIYIKNSQLADLWSHGFVDVKRIKQTDNLGAYLCAYLADIPVHEPESEWTEQDHQYYTSILKKQGATSVASTKVDATKEVIKGGRLHMYPSGMNIFSKSKGIVYPERRPMKYKEVRESLGFEDENLTLRKSVQIEMEEYDFENIIIIEQYNKRVHNPSNFLAEISWYRDLLAKSPSKNCDEILAKELYKLEHRFELFEVEKANLVKKKAIKEV